MLATGLPAVALGLLLLFTGDFTARTQWTVAGLIAGTWLIGAFAVQERVVRPLQTLSNLLAALGEADYSTRARGARPDDALGLAYWEVNRLTETLRARRLDSVEAEALLRRVIAEIHAAIFAFDGAGALQLVNRAGEALLGRPSDALVGSAADDLGLAAYLAGPSERIEEVVFPGKAGRWEIRRRQFRQGGRPHDLLVINDLSAVLREEERQAWRRLVRVLSHEINNSLAPIKSIAESLRGVLDHAAGGTGGSDDDFARGLAIIADRSESLRRFMASYARLARLPPPSFAPVRVEDLVRRVAGLERRRPVTVREGPKMVIRADRDQVEQLLINVIANAVDAVQETDGDVTITWSVERSALEIRVDDGGPGLPDPSNLFVPFFTTKPGGSGIGLVLSRQIAEAHGGSLVVENRSDRTGCTARLRVPVSDRDRRQPVGVA
ncbi:MAG: ATP-binding protein [Gemmatimonadota bacterium]|nr:ATP-binding protein [Gemmatimonadota bacterium]